MKLKKMSDADIGKYIRNIPDFPKKGIQFKDITTLLKDAAVFKESVNWMASLFKSEEIDKVVSLESRGFVFAAPLAVALDAGLVLIRKNGKLPAECLSVKYSLEYGEDIFEMHTDSLKEGERVVIVDDLLATGGTARAAVDLVEKAKASIKAICVLIELEELGGREKIKDYPIYSRIKYPS